MKKSTEARELKPNATENDYIFLSSFRKIAPHHLTPRDIATGLQRKLLLTKVTAAMTAAQSSQSPTLVVGAIPFALQSHPALFLARERSDYPEIWKTQATTPLQARQDIISSPTPKTSIRNVERALDLFKSAKLKKGVLASQINLFELITRLASNNPHAFTFSVPCEAQPAATRFVETSLELLVRKSGGQVMTSLFTGSIQRGATPDEDQANTRKLPASIKDKHEHTPQPCRTSLCIPVEPSLIQMPTVWHLSMRIISELALALHPTPAVCSHPTETAFAAITKIKGFDFDLYTDLIGWTDGSGDDKWAVVRLFAGTGIVPDSNAKAELAKTSAKFCTMVGALGIEERQFDQVVTRPYAPAPTTLN